MSQQNINAPLFTSKDLSATTQAAVAQRGTPATLNLDDIFGDVVFTPDGDTVFKSEMEGSITNSGEGSNVATVASRPTQNGTFAPVPQGGGLYTTQLANAAKMATTMGKAGAAPATAPVPFKQTPQAMHHLQYATANAKKRKAGDSRAGDRKMSEQQKVERRYVFVVESFFWLRKEKQFVTANVDRNSQSISHWSDRVND